MPRRTALAAVMVSCAAGQQVGKQQAEEHPQLAIQSCTKAGGCTKEQRSVTIDSNWRWTNQAGGYQNCFTGGEWNATVCGANVTGAQCAAKCALEGVSAKGYNDTYGVRASGSALNLLFVTQEGAQPGQNASAANVGSRNYLLEDDTHYKMFKLKNREFTFDVDVSSLGCGLNGALYFVEMDADGGVSKYPSNKAGAKLGTGYCDAQCPHDLKFINGEANSEGWSGGVGKYGTCCIELDIWEANKFATAFTPHACNVSGQTRCGDGAAPCGSSGGHDGGRFAGVCDPNGCDMQPYRMGNKTFFGPGLTVDSTKPMTVVTQFVTADGTDAGDVVEVRRLYVQNGNVIPTPQLQVGTHGAFDSVTDKYCAAEVDTFKDGTNFLQKGGMKAMSDVMERGMVLVMSIWDDHAVNMQWLDGTYPPQGGPGALRGPCSASSGAPADVEKTQANASVTYYNIKYGEIGSTYAGGPSPPSPPFPVGPPPPAPAPGPGPSPSSLPSQCGGAPVADGKDCATDPKGPNCCPIGAGGKQQGCFEKNQYWAGCQDACDAAKVDPYDGTKWSCKCLSASCSGGPSPPAPAPAPGPPAPSPSSCPGGSLSACMALCPASPTAAYKACVADCVSRC